MLPLFLDARPDQERRYYELLRDQKPEERGRTAFALSEWVRRLATAGIRVQHPAISEPELRMRLAVRLYGRRIAKRLFGKIPADAR